LVDQGSVGVTTSIDLARPLVLVGDVVSRGEPLALSGYSGIDALVAFPWSVPHVHFNVWLDGDYVDPFAVAGETSLWTHGNEPRGVNGDEHDAAPSADAETAWDERQVEDAIASCTDPEARVDLRSEPDLAQRAMNVLFMRNYYPTRFEGRAPLYRERHAREPWLTLPFRAADFDGIAFAS
jgi:murein DD-endopeptidase